MTFLKIFITAIIVIQGFLILFYSAKTKKTLRTLFLNAFFGLSVFAIINLTSKFTGAYIPINIYTVSGSSAFGVPAVCGFLLLKIIFV